MTPDHAIEMTQDNDILELMVVGELNVDLILDSLNDLPELSKERTAKNMTLALGSSSAILAANAAALGTRVGFVGRAGIDSFGDFVVERLEERGVDCGHVSRHPYPPTGLTCIYTYGNDRGMMTYAGAMEALTLGDMPWEVILSARHLHLSSFYLQSGLRPDCPELFRRAKEAGLSTSFDTNWDPDEQWADDVFDVLDYVDVFLPNDDEARLISGEEDLDRALAVLAERAGAVVVTCGSEGVKARRGDECLTLPAVPVDPVDAVGAGDSFNAGFLRYYVRGESFERCLTGGVLAGAFSTLAQGGTAAFNAPEAFEAFCDARPAELDS